MSFRLAHLSDLHIGPLPRLAPWQLVGKRATGFANWHMGKRKQMHLPAVLGALLQDVAASAPDQVAVTGDMVNLSLGAEFVAGRDVLARIGPPDRVCYVPGNHDAYTLASAGAAARSFGHYMQGDDGEPGFPYVQRRGPLALIGLNSAVPKPMFFASGTLGKRQLQRLEQILAELRGEKCPRVVLIHHPPFAIAPMKRLTDWPALQAIIARHGAELVLHGHTHQGTITALAGPERAVPVVGIASASMTVGAHHEPAAWNLFTFADGHISLTRRSYDGTAFHDSLTKELS